jgi:hypothetical protein
MIPRGIIILPFMIAFFLIMWQYYKIDSKRRVLNLRFALMLGATVGAVSYPFVTVYDPGDRHVSWLYLALALLWLATAYYLWRRMPPSGHY